MEMELNSFSSIPIDQSIRNAVSELQEQLIRIDEKLQMVISPEDFQNLLNVRQFAQKAIANANEHEIKYALKSIKEAKL